MPTRAEQMLAKLNKRFGSAEIEVKDESHLHVGHAGAPEGGESHYRVRIRSASFEGMGRVERHRIVHEILADDLAGGVHALALELSIPGEAPGS